MKHKWHTDEHKKRLSEVRIGVKKSESTKAKMSARWKNNIPEAIRQKMSDSAKKAWDKRKGISNEQ